MDSDLEKQEWEKLQEAYGDTWIICAFEDTSAVYTGFGFKEKDERLTIPLCTVESHEDSKELTRAIRWFEPL